MIELRNIFSAFDGMSGGQIALNRQGIKYNNYYASEVDKWAIQVTQTNYPNTIQLGDIKDVGMLSEIDLMMGGSPCTNFSFAGTQKGMSTKENIEILSLEHYLELKENEFEFQGQSYLFWEYMRMLKLLKPKYFLLENVMMSKKWEKVLTDAIGVEPIMINSALVSAQNRKRLYWTNIPNITQPDDKGILLKDIVDNGWYVDRDKSLTVRAENKTNPSNKQRYFTKSFGQYKYPSPPPLSKTERTALWETLEVFTANEIERLQTVPEDYTKYKISEHSIELYIPDTTAPYCDPYNKKSLKGDKSTTLRLNSSNGNMWVNDVKVGWRKLTPKECEGLQTVPDNYTNIIQYSPEVIDETIKFYKDNPSETIKGFENYATDSTFTRIRGNMRNITQKAHTMTSSNSGNPAGNGCSNILLTDGTWRKLTPNEYEQCQTVPQKYTKTISDTQRYKMLGNGWTIDVIAHILSFIPRF